jgi:hypothetical protein
MVEKETIKRIIKISCVAQAVSAAMDAFLWVTSGFHVPSWTISTIVLGYSVILLA